MTEKEAFDILSQMQAENKASDFVQDILCGYIKCGGWSDSQLYYAKRNAEQELHRRNRESEKRATGAAGLDSIRALLQLARDNGKKFPFIIMVVEEEEYKISLTGKRSKRPGTITINNTTKDQWIGYIIDGRINYGSSELHQALTTLAADPVSAAQQYASATGNCMFCRLQLTVEESIQRSYGPVCAKNHGLPFDFQAYRRKTGIGV